jgi:hypothetical protein
LDQWRVRRDLAPRSPGQRGALFLSPVFAVDYDTKVKPLDRFVTDERPAKDGLTAGEHLFAQTAQSFNYLKARFARGEIKLPESYVPLSSFGQGAKYAGSDQGQG